MRKQGTTAAAIAVLAALYAGTLVDVRAADSEDDVPTQLKKLRDEVDRLKKNAEYDRQMTRSQLKDIDDKLTEMNRVLRNALPNKSVDPDARPVRTGAIKLDNRLGVEARVTIDGTTYTVPPLSSRTLRDRPAAGFVYDVTADGYGVTGARRRTLAADETWTLTIY